MTLREKAEQCLWIAHQLFERNSTGGTTGNISLLHEDCIYISAGGTCFGSLSEDSFCRLRLDGEIIGGAPKPSKEWPLHAALYRASARNQAVIHTHGFYAALWSCLPCQTPEDAIPAYTPYLRMKAAPVRYVPYASPGSAELFGLMAKECAPERTAYLLAHHGALCAGASLMDAFGLIEEIEDSARLAWYLRGESAVKQL